MAKAKRLKDIPREIQLLPFFYPEIKDSHQATDFIKKYDPSSGGCYLVRQSSKGDNYLTISVSINDQSIRHVNVVFEHYGDTYQYHIVPEIRFPAFSQLCRFYKEHRIGNLEKIDNVRLLYPIMRHSDPSHGYERLGNVNAGYSAGGSDSGSNLPQMRSYIPSAVGAQPPFSPAGPEFHSGTPWQRDSNPAVRDRTGNWMSLDSQGNDRHSSGTSSDEQGASSVATSPMQRIPNVKPPVNGKNKPAKTKVNGRLDRPPLPVPNCSNKSDVYYTSPKENINKIENLRKMLKSSEMCDCGIMLIDSELSNGYTIHRSQDENSKNRLFYQNAKGETTWNFPPQLLLNLTEAQRHTIIRLSTEKGMEPPKILFNPDYNIVMTRLLEEKRRLEGSGQTFPAQPAVVNPPGTKPQFDVAKQVVPPGQQQQQFTGTAGSVGWQGPAPTQWESVPAVQIEQTAASNGQQQYLSSTPTSPSAVYVSQNRKQLDNGSTFQPEQGHGEEREQTFPKLPHKK
ncbi:uncharacterized protein LOC121369458 [Gigantopelta aegis]|uniref:uncharacterized protein LOC121369458 n=1 Tax=Gigantopelta aegis TaxID=1735272 RepID=UPI001B8880ED|nr:uncharacterized protein LOC121369458 [Gigantopelta aegis]